MKRFVATLGIAMALYMLCAQVNDFSDAQSWLGIFKAVVLGTLSTFALFGFMDDFKENKWPLS